MPGFRRAVVVLPAGGPRIGWPLAVVAHGAVERAEDHCNLWSEVVADRAILACPRGRGAEWAPSGAGSPGYFPEHHYLGRLMEALLIALTQRLGTELDAREALYVGYSQGATMGSLYLAEQGHEHFARVVMVEGGSNDWTRRTVNRLLNHPGARLVFLTGSNGYARRAADAGPWLRRAGLPVLHRHVAGAGHDFRGPLAGRYSEALDWATAEDPRWTQSKP